MDTGARRAAGTTCAYWDYLFFDCNAGLEELIFVLSSIDVFVKSVNHAFVK